MQREADYIPTQVLRVVLNNMTVYNNSGNSAVSMSKTTKSADCPATGNYMIQITTFGLSSPALGCILQSTTPQAGAIYYHKILAKLPVGYNLEQYNNPIHGKFTWLTSQYGTGEWENYIYQLTVDDDATDLSTFGHVALHPNNLQKGDTGYGITSNEPVTWYVAYANIFETSTTAKQNKFTFKGDCTLNALWGVSEDSNIASGSCGENLTWIFNRTNNSLVISGAGDMDDYNSYADFAPWYQYRDYIKSIVVEPGVTSIGRCAFLSCGTAVDVSIADTVNKINLDAFWACENLTRIFIPSGVENIHYTAFTLCSSLSEIEVDERNQFFCVRDNVLFSKDMTTLVFIPAVALG